MTSTIFVSVTLKHGNGCKYKNGGCKRQPKDQYEIIFKPHIRHH
jgi:hypothetical protein